MKNILKKTAILIIVLFATISCSCPSNPEPNGMITSEQAMKMQTLYLENQHAFINEALGIPPGSGSVDNLNVNFNLEDFEKYICLIKKIAKDSSYSNLGIRVYFGAKTDENGIPKSTVFFSPTYNDSIDFPSETDAYYNFGDSGNGTIGNNSGKGGK